MIGLAIDAVVLIFLLQTINQDNIGLGTALIVALVAAVGTSVLAIGLVALMGTAGLFVAAILAALLLGVAISALFGVEIKRSFLIGGLFMLVHMGVAVAFQMLLGS